ncbi:hypothetical protein CN404_28840 [Bacillus thuringiensis]|uniref:N-acetylmuramoyl-L-alanine amidase family protein n=1 Tax=Bacillus thuringiensis TaxID=1428 RepID=UPI000BF26E1C|nr:hypothetical protein [Bacillus thuringiensis]PFB48746.1 hypothetical protein CN404_28840 [Bacillus thuringiensis]
MKDEQKNFKNHIDKTYKVYEDEVNQKLANTSFAESELAKVYAKMSKIKSPGSLSSDSPLMHEYESKLAPLEAEIKKLKPLAEKGTKLVTQKDKYYSLTVGNPAYQLVHEGKGINLDDLLKIAQQETGWRIFDGKYYYLDKGQEATGLRTVGGADYYLSPTDNFTNSDGTTFKKGEMVTGWVQIDGHLQYFNESLKTNYENQPVKQGQRMTGWLSLDGKKTYYYLGPSYIQNSKGTTFKKGEMATGWVKIGEQWYYFNDSLKTNYKGESVKSGEMITGWFHNKDGKYYYLNENGTMARDETKKINGADSRFDENGVWGGGPQPKSSGDKSTPMN